MAAESAIIPIGEIERRILFIRGQRVMLDADLARVYGVPTKPRKRIGFASEMEANEDLARGGSKSRR